MENRVVIFKMAAGMDNPALTHQFGLIRAYSILRNEIYEGERKNVYYLKHSLRQHLQCVWK